MKENITLNCPKVKNALTYISEVKRNKVRLKVQGTIRKNLKFSINSEENIKVLKEIKENKNIAFIHTDKTGKIVILDKKDFINKMKETFSKMKLQVMNKDTNKFYNIKHYQRREMTRQ